jgi:HK97 family phage major capsid protein
MTSQDMRERRAALISQARELWDTAQKRDNGPSAEDQEGFDRLMGEADKLQDRYQRAEKLEACERDLDAPGERRSAPLPTAAERERAGGKPRDARAYQASPEYREVFSDWMRNGVMATHRIPAEFRDTIIGTNSKGGFLTTPTQLADEVVKQVDDYVFVRQLAKKVALMDAKSLGIPQLTTRMADADWTGEVTAVTEDTTQVLARRDLTPTLLSKLCKVSLRTLTAVANIEEFITGELAYKFGITEEKGYLTGSGSSQPLGIFTASANGVPTSRDVSTGNSTTAIAAANLFEVKYSLKQGYLQDPSTRWLFSRTAVKNIMKLTDSQNRYLWEPSLQAGQPDRLLNIPVAMSEYVPATFTTGLYVGALGALRYYWIAEVPGLDLQRLVERYADTNEVGFIGRRFIDGSPVLGEAFARVTLA